MAKWGEGDPRWIVEERPDATNVNNWHWTEKNASNWSQDKLKQLFEKLKIDDPSLGTCIINEVDKITGEAVANNRKGKLIFFYEWEVKLKWSGRLNGSTNEIKGTIEIPNLSEENEPSEVDVSILVDTSCDESDRLKSFMRDRGTVIIRQQLAAYISALREEFSQGMILPKKESGDSKTTINSTAPVKKPTQKPQVKSPTSNDTGCKLDLKSLKLNVAFKCRSSELYNALTIPEMVQAFTQSAAKLDVKVGGKFELFEGNIQGSFVELVENEKIVQLWRFKSWPSGHHSKVTFSIKQTEDETKLELEQKDIPANEYDKTREGWNRYYWEAIKRTFGFGSFIL